MLSPRRIEVRLEKTNPRRRLFENRRRHEIERMVDLDAVLIMPIIAFAQIPPGYPRDYAATIAAAQGEGKVVIYGATDMSVGESPYPRFPLCSTRKCKSNTMTSTALHSTIDS